MSTQPQHQPPQPPPAQPPAQEPSIEEQISILEALHHDHYTPDELARLLGIGERVIHAAARRGELKAFIVNHHVLDITRADALDWLNRRARE